jgi:hypothetical protein
MLIKINQYLPLHGPQKIYPNLDFWFENISTIWQPCSAGVGKTTTAYLVAKESGYDVMELNASDSRSKKLLEAKVAEAVSSQSVSRVSTKRVSVMVGKARSPKVSF